MIETRSKTYDIERFKSSIDDQVTKLNDKILEIKQRDHKMSDNRGVFIFIYALSLFATFMWKYGNTRELATLLPGGESIYPMVLKFNTNFASYNLLDLSIATATYHYIVFNVIRHRVYFTYASLGLITIGAFFLI